jgi:hypothetical protein
MYIYSDRNREQSDHALPNVEVFYDRGYHPLNGAGWYWVSCFPGCLPDSDPIGPFDTEQDAINDAQEEY